MAVGHNNNPSAQIDEERTPLFGQEGHTPLIGQKAAKAKPNQKKRISNATAVSDSKKEKTKTAISTAVSKLSEADKDKDQKAKIAEEIKLNVAAVGMDLLNSSQKPNSIAKVPDLQSISSPKGLGAQSMPIQRDSGIEADDEQASPDIIKRRSMGVEKQISITHL